MSRFFKSVSPTAADLALGAQIANGRSWIGKHGDLNRSIALAIAEALAAGRAQAVMIYKLQGDVNVAEG